MNLELTSEQAAFLDGVAAFARDEVASQARAIDDTGKYPRDLIRKAASLGLMGVTIPREWGGLGLDYTSYVLAIEVLARASAVVSVIAAVNNSLVVEPL